MFTICDLMVFLGRDSVTKLAAGEKVDKTIWKMALGPLCAPIG